MIETKSIAKWILILITALATPAWGQTDMVSNPVRDNLVDAANSYILVFDPTKISAREVAKATRSFCNAAETIAAIAMTTHNVEMAKRL